MSTHDAHLGTPHRPTHAERTLGELKSGQVSPCTVDANTALQILALCRHKVASRVAKVQQRTAANQRKAARREQEALLSCLEARLQISAELMPLTQRDAASRLPSKHDRQGDRTFCDQWRLAEALRHHEGPVHARLWLKQKRAGGTRPIYSFTSQDKARQRLYALAIRASAGFHPSQSLFRGGRSAVCDALQSALRDVPQGSHFLHLDVRDFFGSISHEWLERNLPFPRRLIRQFIHTGGLVVSHRGGGLARNPCEENQERGRRGIPQGSAASSVVAEFVMADVLRSLADQLPCDRTFIYSDNIGLLVRLEEVSRFEEHLRGAFAGHTAGPFQLRVSHIPITRTFRFLGYDWRRTRAGNVRVRIPKHALEERMGRYMLEMQFGLAALERTRKKYVSYFAAFKLAENAEAVLEYLDSCYRREVERYTIDHTS